MAPWPVRCSLKKRWLESLESWKQMSKAAAARESRRTRKASSAPDARAMDKPKVFVSHGQSENRAPEWVRSFSEALEQAGADVWSDQHVLVGEAWSDALAKALTRSGVVVFLLSPEHLHGPNLMFELGAALAMHKVVVPVLENEVTPSEIPYPLRLRKWLRKTDPEDAAQKVLAAAKAS